MPEAFAYDRLRAVEYAKKWALSQNPLFYDFGGLGGDCTNFVSQCILAGCCRMNFTPTFGWYYLSSDDRAPAWTGVEFIADFLKANADSESPIGDGAGPFAREVRPSRLMLGDVVQLGREDGDFYHTMLVTGFSRRGILVSAHSMAALDRPLGSYSFYRIRCLHIEGYRSDPRFAVIDCDALMSGEGALFPMQ